MKSSSSADGIVKLNAKHEKVKRFLADGKNNSDEKKMVADGAKKGSPVLSLEMGSSCDKVVSTVGRE